MLPETFDAVLVENGVPADQRQVLAQGLRGKQSVERVAVMMWQMLNAHACIGVNIQNNNASLHEFIADDRQRFRQFQFVETGLDCDFPKRGRTDQALIFSGFNRSFRGGREEIRFVEIPEHGVCIKKDTHYR